MRGYNHPVTRPLPELQPEDLELEDGEVATAEHLTEIAARLGGPVRAELLSGCGHAPHHEAPATVIGPIVQWISSWAPSAPAPALRQGAWGGA